MQVEQDQVRPVLECHIQTHLALHRRNEVDLRPLPEYTLYEPEVGQVVLNVE